jgi:putative chitinase
MAISKTQLLKFAPQALNPDSLVLALNTTIDKFDVNTVRRVRYFMAQVSFESMAFTKFEEDLFYRDPQRLCDVWPTHFVMTQGDAHRAYAPEYIRNPLKLGNFIYANRNGNGNQASGDGYLFRGLGPIEVTGRQNYANCSQFLYQDDRLVQHPEQLLLAEPGMMSAGWFWSIHGLNALADQDSFTRVTQIINGSDSSVSLRLNVLNKANLIF